MNSYLNDLNEEQKKAVTHQGSPLLVLAGAGSGKTRVLIYRTHFLIKDQKIDPERILLLTFTNKAAGEMKDRVMKMGEGAKLGFAGTFHTYCARLLRRYGRAIGVNNDYLIYDANDQETLMKMVLKGMGLTGNNNRPGMFLHMIGRAKNDLIDLAEFSAASSDEFGDRISKVWGSYQKALDEAGALDFDDLLVRTVELLRNKSFYDGFRNSFESVLVDEYQDTNKAQFELTKLLAANPKGLTVVGDAAQAIYSFRGADYKNLMMLDKEYPDLKTVTLKNNYRSTQMILDAANGVISNNKNHPILQLESTISGGEKIKMVEVLDEKEEAACVVSAAEEASKNDESLAVLYRTNAQSRAIEEALIRRNVPYRLVGGVRFYDRLEVKDMLACIRIVANQKDLVSWERIEKNFGKRIKNKLIELLDKEGDDFKKNEPRILLDRMAEETGYLDRFDEKDEDDVARLENIRELMAVASEFDNLADFLESVALVSSDELADKKETGSKLTLMTIHSAKGLEFDRVMVVGLEEGILPHSRSLLSREDIEEERRLVYVAMTRARKNLYLSYVRSRLTYGGRQSSQPSRFLAEIPEEAIVRTGSQLKYREVAVVDRQESFDGDRRIVSDWEIEKEVKKDFEEIDAW